MALEVDEAALLHLGCLIPGQVVRIGVEEIRNEEDRCLQVVFLQDGIGILVVVHVTVVEGDDDGLIGELRAVIPGIRELGGRDGVIAVVGQILHLGLELVRLDGQRVVVDVVDLVVVEDGDAVLRAVHAHEGIGTEDEQQAEDDEQGPFQDEEPAPLRLRWADI